MTRTIVALLIVFGGAGWPPGGRCPAQLLAAAQAGPPLTATAGGQAGEQDDGTTPELDAKVDDATDKALAYLASIQQPNGSWLAQAGKDKWRATGYEPAVGSLAIMAFLSKGHMPEEEPYGQHIEKALDFVLSRQLPNGYISGTGNMYTHGISTLMLAEVSGQVTGKRQKQVKQALARAIKLILDAQQVKKSSAHTGGWRYQPTSGDSDLSLTGWQLMALRAAKNSGAEVPDEAIERAVAYVIRSAHAKGGFCYTPGGSPTMAMAGTGILALELCGRHHARESLAAGDWLLAQGVRPYGGSHQYYTMYYCSQAMFQLGDRYFKQFWPTFAAEVIKRQQPDGSFPLGSGAEANAGPGYGTSMAVLSLAVRYRLLPIYQR